MYIIIPYTWHLLDITSKICIVILFVILDLQNVFTCNVYGLSLFQSSHVNGSLIIDIIPKAKANVCIAAILLLYILQKHYHNKSYRFSQDLLVFEDTKVSGYSHLTSLHVCRAVITDHVK
jgi:hypothetical protein